MSVLQKSLFYVKKCILLKENRIVWKMKLVSLCFYIPLFTRRFNTENICFLYFCLIFAQYIEFLK